MPYFYNFFKKLLLPPPAPQWVEKTIQDPRTGQQFRFKFAPEVAALRDQAERHAGAGNYCQAYAALHKAALGTHTGLAKRPVTAKECGRVYERLHSEIKEAKVAGKDPMQVVRQHARNVAACSFNEGLTRGLLTGNLAESKTRQSLQAGINNCGLVSPKQSRLMTVDANWLVTWQMKCRLLGSREDQSAAREMLTPEFANVRQHRYRDIG